MRYRVLALTIACFCLLGVSPALASNLYLPLTMRSGSPPMQAPTATLTSEPTATPSILPPTATLAPTSTPTIIPSPGFPGVQFGSATYTIGEDEDSAIVVVTLSAASSQSITVNYATSDGTALATSDYTATSGTLTFAAGETSQGFTVPITDDTLNEANETINLVLTNPANATLGTATTTLTIVDNDAQPTVQFGSATYTVNESTGNATIDVRLSAASGQSITVNYSTSNGSALAGVDYTATSGTLTFAAGETSKTLTIPILANMLYQPDRTVQLTLSTPTNATLGPPNPATLTITDSNQPTMQFSAATYTVSEDVGNATITVNLSNPSTQAITVNYATSDGTATASSDYTAATGTLTFAPGVTSQTFIVSIIDDSLNEANEMLNLALSNAINAMLGAQSTATLTIMDNDSPPTVQFGSTMHTIAEGNSILGSKAVIDVQLSAPSGRTVRVNYTTSDGTATTGSDYTQATGTLIFAPGETVKTFDVPITGDTVYEDDETINLTLSNPINTSIVGTNPAVLTITNDDASSTVQFSSATYTVGENGGSATITVVLSNPVAQPVTVNYATSNGTATVGSDYIATSGTLTFAPGVTSQTFTVPIIDDTLNEANETVNLALSTPTNATLGTPVSATLTITNDDPLPTVQFSSATYTVAENGGMALVTVTLSNPTAQAVTVNYATSNGTATAGSDYTATNGVLTFAPGETSKTFTVPIVDDVLGEPNEMVNLTLSGALNAQAGTVNATLTILDNEPRVEFSLASYDVGETMDRRRSRCN